MKTKTKIISALGLIILVSLAVLGIFWFSQSAKLKATGQKAEAKLAEKFNQAPEIKNSYQLDKLSLIQPAKDENSVEITVGDPSASTFVPELTVKKWDGEASFNMKYTSASIQTAKNAAATPNINLDNNKIIYSDGTSDVHFYEKPDDAYEVEFILKEKPESNVVTTDIETKNLDFFYQPALNEGPLEPGVDHCTETQCFDKDGKVVNERPENVVGSYAVYYKDGKSGDYSAMGGKNYQTGKAFHIYRPQVIDANGNKVWAELKVDTEKNIMSVTVPQDFLDKAVYPVTVDPTFGYTTAGTSQSTGGDTIQGGRFTTGVAGILSSISVSCHIPFTGMNDNAKAGVYNGDAFVDGSNEVLVTNSIKHWETFSGLTQSISASTPYGLVIFSSKVNFGASPYYDTTGGSGITAYQVYGSWPGTVTFSTNTRKYSIYATYTASVSAPTVTNSSGASNITETTARLNGEVTATGGENPTIHIYWGTTDGGTTAGSWANDVNLGALGAGTFYTDISSLTAGTTYYYRSYATNSGGSAWTASTATFDLMPIPATFRGQVRMRGEVRIKAGGVAAPAWACGDTLTYCGDNYTTVQMTSTYGSGCWLGENLRNTTKPDCTTAITTYCNPSGCDSPWGRLYIWTTVMNGATTATGCGAKIQGICPTGWHIPSDYTGCTSAPNIDDFPSLGADGGALKKVNTSSGVPWTEPNTGATNTSNWTGYPAGRYAAGAFSRRGSYGYSLSSSQADADLARGRLLRDIDATFPETNMTKPYAFSVRCVKD